MMSVQELPKYDKMFRFTAHCLECGYLDNWVVDPSSRTRGMIGWTCGNKNCRKRCFTSDTDMAVYEVFEDMFEERNVLDYILAYIREQQCVAATSL